MEQKQKIDEAWWNRHTIEGAIRELRYVIERDLVPADDRKPLADAIRVMMAARDRFDFDMLRSKGIGNP